MPLLDLAQRQEGWLSRTAMDYIADLLSIPPIRVYEVATFYTMYRLRPVGKHHIQLCTNISCWLRGSDDIKRAAEEVFGMHVGESNDEATIEEVECAGACCNAPVAQIGDDYYEDLTYENAKALFQALKDGKPVMAGSQIGRKGSCPEGGPTTLKELG
jgi:NADH-quinone oxidoreductase subunit E